MRKKFMAVFSSVLLVVVAVSGVWAAELPKTFDLRDYNMVPSKIRNQGGFGLCWAFAALGSIESNYMMNVSEDARFAIQLLNDTTADNPHTSELHLGWFTRKAETGQEYRVFSVVSGDKLFSMKELEANPILIVKGANWRVPTAFLSRGFGYAAVLHSDLPYPDPKDTDDDIANETLKGMVSNGTIAKAPTDSKYRSVLLLTNVDTMEYPTNRNASDFTKVRDGVIRDVKEILMNTGAMTLTYTDVSGARNETYKSYYCSDADIKNIEKTKPNLVGGHAVTLIGWDDTFPKERFQIPGRELPTIDGAWLIRNSWGNDNETHDHGYFWMSYEQEVDFQSYIVSHAYDDLYCYEWDHLGWCRDWGGVWKSEDSYAVNVFKTGNQPVTLNWIGFYTCNEGIDMTFYVRNYGTTKPNESNVWTVAPSLTMTVSRDYVGYHTAELNQTVTIPANSYFSVGMKVDKYFETPIAVETRLKGYSDYARVSDGESFFSTDGVTWKDGTKMTRTENNKTFVSPMNACIKVFVTGAEQQQDSQPQQDSKQQQDSTETQVYEDWVVNGKPVIDRPDNTVNDGQLMEANNPSGANAAVTTGREFSVFLLDSNNRPLAEGTQAELTFMFCGSDSSYDQYYDPDDDDDFYSEGDAKYYYGYVEQPGDEWLFELYPEGYEPKLYVNDEGELFASYQRTVTVGENGNVTLKADDIPTATAGKSAPVGYYDVFYEVSSDVVGTLPVIHITDTEEEPHTDTKGLPGSSSSGCDLGLSILGFAGLSVFFIRRKNI